MEKRKILILGGANVHCKLVRAAKELGLYTIVTDYLPDSPAKKMADKSYMYDIMDIDGIVAMCREEGVSAVLSTHLDPCQRPYQQICQRLGLPCFGTQDQVFRMTDKHAFKRMCAENNVDTIPEYSLEEIQNDTASYPVFIKPVDSRGSRGQSVCYCKEEALTAVELAKSESTNGDILIEKYMADAEEVQITYFFMDGQAHLIRTTDSYRGTEAEGLEKVVLCAVSPSKHTEEYLQGAHHKVVEMFRKLGLENGPAFMQGFYDNGKFRFFDPGLRFPGVDYEEIYRKVYDIDLPKMMVEFSVNGSIRNGTLPENSAMLSNKQACVLFPTMSAGTIAEIRGVESLCADTRVVSFLQRHDVGDTVEWTYNVNQRFAEIDILCENGESLHDTITWALQTIEVLDIDGNGMLMQKRCTLPRDEA